MIERGVEPLPSRRRSVGSPSSAGRSTHGPSFRSKSVRGAFDSGCEAPLVGHSLRKVALVGIHTADPSPLLRALHRGASLSHSHDTNRRILSETLQPAPSNFGRPSSLRTSTTQGRPHRHRWAAASRIARSRRGSIYSGARRSSPKRLADRCRSPLFWPSLLQRTLSLFDQPPRVIVAGPIHSVSILEDHLRG